MGFFPLNSNGSGERERERERGGLKEERPTSTIVTFCV